MPCLTLARPIEVLLIDDQRAILAGVTALIESEGPGMHVAGRAMTGQQALALASCAQPDVIVLDVDLGGEDGLTLIPGLLSACGAAIIVFTCLIDPAARHRAAHFGAAGFIQKTASGTELIAAIRRATNSTHVIETD